MTSDRIGYYDPVDGTPLLFCREGLKNDFTGNVYPVVNGVPRFVISNNYAYSFGLQWKTFSNTQLDSHNGTAISYERLSRCMRGHLENGIIDKLVLEAGSGAGRFTEIFLKKGAFVHSFDLSGAVDANYANNGLSERLLLAQADILKMPFKSYHYDYVVCLGVLQHTPNPEEAIVALFKMLKPGGFLVFDHYRFKLRSILPPPLGVASNIYRPLLLALPQKYRLKVVKAIVTFFFPAHWLFRYSLIAQRILRRISPVIFYFGTLELKSKWDYFEWSLLDTHDCLTDFHRHHRSVIDLRNFLESLNPKRLEVHEGENAIEVFVESR